MPDDTPRLYALRGATTVAHDTSADISERTAELLGVVLDRNDVAIDDIVSVILSATPDLRADFPAVAARSIGLSRTPLLCCQEIAVEGAVERCVRVLLHVYLPTGSEVHHVYLHGASQLRLDLPE
jgi:chorismate mutase